jgi:hypothetical protein
MTLKEAKKLLSILIKEIKKTHKTCIISGTASNIHICTSRTTKQSKISDCSIGKNKVRNLRDFITIIL